MKSLLKMIFTIGLFFTSMMLFFKITGVLEVDQIRLWFFEAENFSVYFIAGIVVLLLALDLIIAVPTLSISILGSYFLGFWGGFFSSLLGTSLAGFAGYFLSRKFGEGLFVFVIKKESERKEMQEAFREYGLIMILLARGAPVFPEVSACLAGLTKMKLSLFSLAWFGSSVPYLMVASYAGSYSSIDNPMPAIYAFIVLSGILWLSWYFLLKDKLSRSKKSKNKFII